MTVLRKLRSGDSLIFMGIVTLLAPLLLFGGMADFASQLDIQARKRQEAMLSHGFDVQIRNPN